MLTEFTTPFVEGKAEYIDWLKGAGDVGYATLLKKALEIAVKDMDGYEKPDPERIHTIDDGDWQGTLVFVIAAQGYQPDDYWYTKVAYGSCSGCDALESAWDYGRDKDLEAVYSIALHMLQRMREMTDVAKTPQTT